MQTMSVKKQNSFLPAHWQILSGSALKMIAVITMLIDHIGANLLSSQDWAREQLFSLPWETVTWYSLFRGIGRIAFPIYCFLLIEGFRYTHSRVKYALNLLLFACLSEIPWNYVHSGTWQYAKQNVFFTLFLGYLGICAMGAPLPFFDKETDMEQTEGEWVKALRLLLAGVLLYVSVKLKADYGWRGYLFILLMYGLRKDPALQALLGGGWLSYEWKAVFAFLPINMYNGERGFIRGKAGKYFFYAFYPVHLLILGWLKFH